MELCPALVINIPVGKDSMSMRASWSQDGEERRVSSPLSLIVSAFAPVRDARRTLTPQIRLDQGPSKLLLIDLGGGQDRLGGSALAHVHGALGATPPDLDNPELLKGLFRAVRRLSREGRILAMHDRSDGGLLVTLLEMAFAGHAGLDVELPGSSDALAGLFSEELGQVLQVRERDLEAVQKVLELEGLSSCSVVLGTPTGDQQVRIRLSDGRVLGRHRADWHRIWAETSYRMQALRDHPDCAGQEFDALLDHEDPGISPVLSFEPGQDIAAPYISTGTRPRVAILREQGINGQVEMAAAFDRAGFDAVDVHMNDLIAGEVDLGTMRGLVACGGFSYGDVLGAGGGWAGRVLHREDLRAQFQAYFSRNDTFSLGICNGCQMLALLSPLIPGSESWPRLARNQSEQFEARVCTVEVLDSPSILLRGMQGSRVPIAVAHGEGRIDFSAAGNPTDLQQQGLVALRYVDNRGEPTTVFPLNPNGSQGGITGLTTPDGRVTLMMPHPERVFRTVTNSWAPDDWGEDGPWMRLFRNARVWVN
jgi:phosphoribosylformylglycinamidine synthase